MSLMKIGAVLAVAGFAAGCSVDPRSYETPPVKLKSAKGEVTCQLYTPKRVLWDRAIDWPRSMTAQEADDICRAEGLRQKQAS